MKKLALPALLSLAACLPEGAATERIRSIDGETGRDGYVFQQREFTRLDQRIVIHLYPSVEALRAVNGPGSLLVGRAQWGFFAGVCHIHVVDPAARYMPDIIGHELAHCMHGNFHPGQESPR